MMLTTARSVEDIKPSVVIVGGTDGSGTRRVVQVLSELGVKMVSEDPETYDIHADLVGGWPPIVSPVIRHTRSLLYHPQRLATTFPQHNRQVNSLQRLLQQVEIDSHKPTSHVLAKGGVLPRPVGVSAANAQYGFKAPVSMTLLPYWHSLIPNLLFLHVLRDGRDIAFSVNQGPVDKFYADMYANAADLRLSPPQKAIKLWSDWNTALYRYAEDYVRHATAEGATPESATSPYPRNALTYFAVHSEDLVDEERAVRFAAIYALAKVVRSSLPVEEICCLSVKDAGFMGSHDRSVLKGGGAGGAEVSTRYGKWRKKVAEEEAHGRGGLGAELHRLGAEGLAVFGYEPLRPHAQAQSVPYDTPEGEEEVAYHCTMSVTECIQKYPLRMEPLEKTDKAGGARGGGLEGVEGVQWDIPGQCDVQVGVDFRGEDLEAVSIDINHPSDCCR